MPDPGAGMTYPERPLYFLLFLLHPCQALFPLVLGWHLPRLHHVLDQRRELLRRLVLDESE